MRNSRVLGANSLESYGLRQVTHKADIRACHAGTGWAFAHSSDSPRNAGCGW